MRKIITSWIIVWLAGGWAWAFAQMATNGGRVTFREPNATLLWVEFSLAAVLAIVGLVSLVKEMKWRMK